MIELVLLQGALMTAFGSGLLLGYFLNTLIGYMNKQSYTVVCVDTDHAENDSEYCEQEMEDTPTSTTEKAAITTPTDQLVNDNPTTRQIQTTSVKQPEPATEKPVEPVKEPFVITPLTGVKQYESSYGRPYNTINEQEFLEYEGAYIKQLRAKPNVHTKIPERNVYEDYKPRKEQSPRESRKVSRLKRQHQA